MKGNLICAVHGVMYKYRYQRARGKRSKAATCTRYKYIAASCKPFLRACSGCPRHILGRVQRRSCQAIHPSHRNKTPVPYFYQRTYLSGAHSKIIYTSHFYAYQSPLLVVFAKTVIVVVVIVIVGNNNTNSCQNKVGYQEGGSGDISSLASCCLTLTPAFHCTSAPQSYDDNTWIL